MCAVVDEYDDLVCGLGGRPPVAMGEALQRLSRGAGSRFDPELVQRFASVVRDEAKGRGMKTNTNHGLREFQALVAALREDRGFV